MGIASKIHSTYKFYIEEMIEIMEFTAVLAERKKGNNIDSSKYQMTVWIQEMTIKIAIFKQVRISCQHNEPTQDNYVIN